MLQQPGYDTFLVVVVLARALAGTTRRRTFGKGGEADGATTRRFFFGIAPAVQ
jgi:hypothetical protein